MTRPIVVLFLSLYLACCVDRSTTDALGTVWDSAGIALIDIPPDYEAGPAGYVSHRLGLGSSGGS